MSDQYVTFARRPLVIAFAVATVIMLAVTVQSSIGWIKAANARTDAKTAISKAEASKDCLATSFSDLTVALTSRGDLAEAERAIDKRERELSSKDRGQLRTLLFATSADPPLTEAQGKKLFDKYIADQRQIAKDQKAIDKARIKLADERKRVVIPPYPAGKCDNPKPVKESKK